MKSEHYIAFSLTEGSRLSEKQELFLTLLYYLMSFCNTLLSMKKMQIR